MNETENTVAAASPAPWHAATTKLIVEPSQDVAAAVSDSGRIRIGAAFRLVTRR